MSLAPARPRAPDAGHGARPTGPRLTGAWPPASGGRRPASGLRPTWTACSTCWDARSGRPTRRGTRCMPMGSSIWGIPAAWSRLTRRAFPKRGCTRSGWHRSPVARRARSTTARWGLSWPTPGPGATRCRPGAVPARGLDEGWDAPAGGGAGSRHALRDQASAGPAHAGRGARPGCRWPG